MLNPAAAYRFLARQPLGGVRLALQRPLFVAFVLGCTMSLITAASLSLISYKMSLEEEAVSHTR
jgi:hypothetical protein